MGLFIEFMPKSTMETWDHRMDLDSCRAREGSLSSKFWTREAHVQGTISAFHYLILHHENRLENCEFPDEFACKMPIERILSCFDMSDSHEKAEAEFPVARDQSSP